MQITARGATPGPGTAGAAVQRAREPLRGRGGVGCGRAARSSSSARVRGVGPADGGRGGGSGAQASAGWQGSQGEASGRRAETAGDGDSARKGRPCGVRNCGRCSRAPAGTQGEWPGCAFSEGLVRPRLRSRLFADSKLLMPAGHSVGEGGGPAGHSAKEGAACQNNSGPRCPTMRRSPTETRGVGAAGTAPTPLGWIRVEPAGHSVKEGGYLPG